MGWMTRREAGVVMEREGVCEILTTRPERRTNSVPKVMEEVNRRSKRKITTAHHRGMSPIHMTEYLVRKTVVQPNLNC